MPRRDGPATTAPPRAMATHTMKIREKLYTRRHAVKRSE